MAPVISAANQKKFAMSVYLPPKYRVIAIIMVAGIAFVALAWTGDNRLAPLSIPGSDTVPSPQRPAKKAPKPKKRAEGRVARQLDLRIDVEDTLGMPDIPEMPELNKLNDLDMSFDLDALKGLNAQVEGDVLKNMDAWNNLDALKELDFRDMVSVNDLDELKGMFIEEEDLQTLKDLNIDDDTWNELRGLKDQMDDLREQLEEDRANGVSEYRLHREVDAIMEAVRAEMPRVRREVQKAVEEYRDPRKWQ